MSGRIRPKAVLLFALALVLAHPAFAQSHQRKHPHELAPVSGMVCIPGGYYRPFYIVKGIDSVWISTYHMDARAVTNGEFLEFVKTNPKWSRSRVSPMLAEKGYLKAWQSDFEIGNNALVNAPVVNVSWFAARAYAAWCHKHLPTVAQWEYAASAPIVEPVRATARAKQSLILAWYSKPMAKTLAPAGTVNENAFGLRDMFGQVWEWTDDFSSVIVPGDARGTSGGPAVCGAGAIGSIDPTDYATFMRFAMRSSLKANYVVDDLGFRCVK